LIQIGFDLADYKEIGFYKTDWVYQGEIEVMFYQKALKVVRKL
jgi:hypothetical protein